MVKETASAVCDDLSLAFEWRLVWIPVTLQEGCQVPWRALAVLWALGVVTLNQIPGLFCQTMKDMAAGTGTSPPEMVSAGR